MAWRLFRNSGNSERIVLMAKLIIGIIAAGAAGWTIGMIADLHNQTARCLEINPAYICIQ